MKLHTFTFHLSLLIVAAPTWGQSQPLSVDNEARRPLNLSVPRDVLATSNGIVSTESQDTVERNLPSGERQKEGMSTERSPYGTGYEARQRGTASGGNSGFGGGSTHTGSGRGAGAGGGGRGGMGRGR